MTLIKALRRGRSAPMKGGQKAGSQYTQAMEKEKGHGLLEWSEIPSGDPLERHGKKVTTL